MIVSFSDLVGKTIVSFDGDKGDDEIILRTSDGSVYKMDHTQDCCEDVHVDDITGDIKDLLNYEIVVAEEVESEEHQSYHDEHEYEQWTFYKLDTVKGGITIRWYGVSNGYYSTRVDFTKVK
jgi:hypothetical protein